MFKCCVITIVSALVLPFAKSQSMQKYLSSQSSCKSLLRYPSWFQAYHHRSWANPSTWQCNLVETLTSSARRQETQVLQSLGSKMGPLYPKVHSVAIYIHDLCFNFSCIDQFSGGNLILRQLIDGSSQLQVFRATPANHGTYRCVATSPLGTISSRY